MVRAGGGSVFPLLRESFPEQPAQKNALAAVPAWATDSGQIGYRAIVHLIRYLLREQQEGNR